MVFVSVQFVSAQKTKDTNATNPKKETAFFIDRTSNIMYITYNAVKKNKVYTGYLKKAADNQKEAITFFGQSNYEQAAKSSYTSRRYSFLAYVANKQNVPEGWKLNEREKELYKKLIKTELSNEELKAAISEADATSEQTLEIKKEDFPKVGNETSPADRAKKQKDSKGNKGGKVNG